MRKSEIAAGITLLLVLLPFLSTGCKRGSAGVGGESDTLTGVWNTTYGTPMGQVSSQLIVKDDGTYQKMDQMTNGAYPTLISGKYQVSGQSLRLNIEHGEPTQSCGPLGCDPIVYPAAESYSYSLPGNGTLQLQGMGCDPSLCTYIYKRGM